MISDQLLYLFYYYARRKSQQDQRWQEESEDEQLERQTGFVACVVTRSAKRQREKTTVQ
jgi:hypothetical protein